MESCIKNCTTNQVYNLDTSMNTRNAVMNGLLRNNRERTQCIVHYLFNRVSMTVTAIFVFDHVTSLTTEDMKTDVDSNVYKLTFDNASTIACKG